MTTGILSFGGYIPRKRLQRSAIHAANAWFTDLGALAKGERAIADWDEDSITMAVEAARDTLMGIDRGEVRRIALASTTLPFLDRQNSGVVKEALNLSDDVGAVDVAGSQRAATAMLIQALEAAPACAGAQLCLAADLRKTRPASEAELINGDAAAGLLIGRGNPVARMIGSYSTTVDFVDHFRAAGMEYDYAWENRWIRDEGFAGIIGEALASGLRALGVSPERIDRLLIPVTLRGVANDLARRAGIRPEAVADTLADRVGHSGAAHPLLMLVAALETAAPGEILLLTGFGQGVDLILLETTDALSSHAGGRGIAGHLARGIADDNYLRWLFHRGALDLERGMRAESDQKQPGTTLWRDRKTVLGLVGGRCTRTGTVHFPKSDISVDLDDCAMHAQEDYALADRRARIVSYTADALTYSPAPPAYYGLIDFDGGGRMMAEFTEMTAGDIEVGREMEMRFRIKAVDDMRGFTKYFWKAAPAVQAA